jgi:uncharacterized protein HemY
MFGIVRLLVRLIRLAMGMARWAEERFLEQADSRPDGARLARCYRKLGMLHLKTERTAEAMPEQVFGAQHAETAQGFGDLGMLLRRHGDHAQAQLFLRRALDIHREASGLDSQEATQGLYHLASSLEESGDPSGAAGEFERLLALRRGRWA